MAKHNCTDCKIRSVAENFLSNDEFGSLESNSAEVSFKKGEIIIKQNALSLNVVYLRSGLVKIHMAGPAKEKILRLVKAPSYLGIPTTLGNKINNYSVTALQDTSVCFIDANFFKMLIAGNGQFASEIILELCKNELFDQQRTVNQEQKQLPGRIADTFLCMSERLFDNDEFEVPLSRNELADLIGTTRESLSRVLGQFCKENIISLDGKIMKIIDRPKLQQICDLG